MTVQVKPIYAQVYQALQENIDDVLREHAIEQLEQRITATQQNIQQWEARYHCDYPTFAERVATDLDYVRQLNAHPETQMWEGDLIEWEVELEDLQRWQHHLQILLNAS